MGLFSCSRVLGFTDIFKRVYFEHVANKSDLFTLLLLP